MSGPERITLAMTGASGAQYGLRLLDCLVQEEREVHFLISKAAQLVMATETDVALPANREWARAILERAVTTTRGAALVDASGVASVAAVERIVADTREAGEVSMSETLSSLRDVDFAEAASKLTNASVAQNYNIGVPVEPGTYTITAVAST